DARTTTASTPAMNCPRGQRKFHTALLLIQPQITYFVQSCRVPNSNRYASASEAACNLLSLITGSPRRRSREYLDMLTMMQLGVAPVAATARLVPACRWLGARGLLVRLR